MRKPFSDCSPGFSLIELLVVITIVLLFSGLILGGLRGTRNHQVVALAASRFEMLLELARSAALSEGKPAYLVIADHQSLPEGVPMRAYTFIRDLEDPELMNHWQFLPKDVVFAQDTDPDGADLVNGDPLAELAFTDQVQGSQVEGPVRVLLELSPDGTLRSGSARELQAATLLLERGDWLHAGTGWVYLAKHTEEEDEGGSLDAVRKVPLDAVRIRFRPRSGVIQIKDKVEALP